MRYPQGGGLTDERREFRERIRLEAAGMFADGQPYRLIAKRLRVSVRSVQRWRLAYEANGESALRSKGPASRPELSDKLFTALEEELAKGPVAHGWPDQTWSLARIKTLIGRRFHKTLTLSTIAQMLRRHGWSRQVPARRAGERDQDAVTGWVKETWPLVETPRRARWLDRLRGRGRLLDVAAHLPHLGPARAHPGDTRPRGFPGAHLGGGPVLLPPR